MIENLPSRYELKAPCGTGRFATVFHAWDSELQRDVALKVSDIENRSSLEASRIRGELKISCKLRHPNIASGFDGFEQGTHVVLSLPLLTGGTLAKPHGDKSPTLPEKLRRFLELCNAVAYIHKLGLIHADIKPENVLLDKKEGLVLTDFGSCMIVKQPSTDVVGTAAYLAPELAGGKSPPSIQSDVYALGATLFQYLCGQAPFIGDTKSILASIGTQRFPSIRKIDSRIDRSVEAIINKACNSELKLRYATVAEFGDDIKAFVLDQPITATKTNRFQTAYLWSKRNPTSSRLISTLGAVVIVGTLFSSISWWRSIEQQNAIKQSEIVLKEQAQQAIDKEQQLQVLLTSISKERDVIAEATANEVRWLAEAQLARDKAFEKSQFAEEQFAEAAQFGAMTASLKGVNTTLDEELHNTQERLKANESFVADRLVRRQSNDAMIQCAAAIKQGNWKVAKEKLESVTLRFRGVAYRNLAFSIGGKRSGANVVSLPRVDLRNLKRIIFDRLGESALILSEQPRIELLQLVEKPNKSFDLKSTKEFETPSFTQNRKPHTAAFNPLGNKVAVAYISDKSDHAIVVRQVSDLSANNRVYPLNFEGEIASIRFLDNQSIVVIRINKSNNDIEIVDVFTNRILWSCRKNRLANMDTAVIGTLDAEANHEILLPLFIDVGTDPWKHLLFASTTKPTPGKPTYTFLHSVNLQSHIDVATFDCGKQFLNTWPHQWYVTPQIGIGLGQKSISFQDPPIISNARFLNRTAMMSPNDHPLTIQTLRNGWKPIENMPNVPLRLVYLEADIYLDWGSPIYKTLNPWKPDSSFTLRPQLDTRTGHLLVTTESGTSYAIDPIEQQIIELPSSIYIANPSTGFTLASNESHLQLIADKNGLKAILSADWDGNSYPNLVDVNQGLEATAKRLKEMISDESLAALLRSNETAMQRHNSAIEIDIQPSVGFIDCQTTGGGFQLSNIKIDDLGPKTFEAVLRMEDVKRPAYSSIITTNLFLGLKLSPTADIFFENMVFRDSKMIHNIFVPLKKTPFNRWIHVAGCFDGDKEFLIYLNGRLQLKKFIEFKTDTERKQTFLSVGQPSPLFGQIDSVRISKDILYRNDFIPRLPMYSDKNTIVLYQFDETEGNKAFDSGPNRYHAEIVNPQWRRVADVIPEYVAPNPALVAEGSAIQFDSLDQIAFIDNLELDDNQPLTFEALVNLDSNSPVNAYTGVMLHRLFEIKVNPSRKFAIGRTTYLADKAIFNDIVSPRSLLSKWVHIAGCWDGDKTLSMFIDGNPSGRTQVSQGTLKNTTSAGRLVIGGRENAQPLGGQIDAIKVSRGVRYSNKFVPDLPFKSDSDTTLLLDFNEGQGLVIKDKSLNNHDAITKSKKWTQTDFQQNQNPNRDSNEIKTSTSSLPQGYAIRSDDRISDAFAYGIEIEPSSPLTLEAIVFLDRVQRAQLTQICNLKSGFGLRIKPSANGDVVGFDHFHEIENNKWYGTGAVAKTSCVNEWFHVAGSFDGNKMLSVYINGKLEAIQECEFKPSPSNLTDLAFRSHLKQTSYSYIDSMRLSKGVRYPKGFTPQTPFQADETTVALFLFDEGAGTIARDLSLNEYTASIDPNAWVPIDKVPIPEKL